MAATAPSAMLSLPASRATRSGGSRKMPAATVLPFSISHWPDCTLATVMPAAFIASWWPRERCCPLKAVAMPSMMPTLSPALSRPGQVFTRHLGAQAVVRADEGHVDVLFLQRCGIEPVVDV